MLRFFIDDRRYSIVDRLAFALSIESAETSLLEALRVISALMERSINAVIKSKTGKEYRVTCCDYGEGDGPGINGEFVSADKKELVGKGGYCVPCPIMPSREELNELLKELRNDLTIGRRIAILAYGFREKKEEIS